MRIRRSAVFAAALVVALPLAAAAAEQKPPIPSLGETIEVSLVNVDVFVTDKSGKRVRGLTKDDFEIFENGVKQPITNFTEYTGETPPAFQTTDAMPPLPSAPAAPRQKRTIVVFVGRFYLPNFRTTPFFASIKKMLHDAIRPGDRAMVVTWNRGVLLTEQGLTDSLPNLDHAIDAVAKLSSQPVDDVRTETRWMITQAQSFDQQAAAEGMSTNGNGVADMEMDYVAQIEKWSQQRKIQTINALIRAVAADEGKKILLLVTHRLSREAGAETYRQGGVNGMMPLEKKAAMDMSRELKTIDDTANANGVTIYPLFPEGLETTNTDSSESAAVPVVDYQTLTNETSALREVAEETGGLTAWGTDSTKLLPRVSEDLDSYYSLAYRVQSTGKDRPRKIVVKTKDPGLVVRSRREFMDKSDTTRMEDRVIAALFNNPPASGFPLHVAVGRRQNRGKKLIIPLTIHVPVSALTQVPERGMYAGAFSVYFAWGGKLGGISDTSRETRNYAISAAQINQARASGHLTYDVQLAVDQKTEKVAFGVVDEISKDYALRLMAVR